MPQTAIKHSGIGVALALCAASALLWAASHANAQGLAANSCWGRCTGDAVDASGHNTCGCDPACQTRGDCCPDKHTYCPMKGARGLCPLTKPNAAIGFFGTDLGWSFEHKNKLEILFGDTWSAAQCTAPAPNDDAQATLSLARPSWLPTDTTSAFTCQTLPTFRTTTVANTVNFTPIKLIHPSRGALPLGALATPSTAWSDGTRAYVLFVRGETQSCSMGAPACANGLSCDFALSTCIDPSSAQTGAYASGVMVHVAYRLDENRPAEYFVTSDFLTNKFVLGAAETVQGFSPATGVYNYAPGTSSDAPATVLVFGRPGAGALPGGEAPLYLLYNTLSTTGGLLSWSPQYFAGLVNGQPTWSTNQLDAEPVADVRTGAGLIPDEFAIVNQTEVVWVAALRRWVMLYGGDLADRIYSPATDQPRRGAVHMRLSRDPWGPWSDPVPLLWREHVATSMACDAPAPTGLDNDVNMNGRADAYESPGQWPSAGVPSYASRCVIGDRNRPGPNGCMAAPASASLERGNLYAPNVIGNWTAPLSTLSTAYERSALIYFNVSTWNPYQVVLASAQIDLPYEVAPYFVRALHLRDYRNKLLQAGTTLNAKSSSPGDVTTHFLFSNATSRRTEMQIGDSVLISASGGRYLTRTSTYKAGYITTSGPLPPEAHWKIVGGAPAGTKVLQDSMKIALEADNGLHLKSWNEDGTVELHSGLGGAAYWTPTWFCDPSKGDSC